MTNVRLAKRAQAFVAVSGCKNKKFVKSKQANQEINEFITQRLASGQARTANNTPLRETRKVKEPMLQNAMSYDTSAGGLLSAGAAQSRLARAATAMDHEYDTVMGRQLNNGSQLTEEPINEISVLKNLRKLKEAKLKKMEWHRQQKERFKRTYKPATQLINGSSYSTARNEKVKVAALRKQLSGEGKVTMQTTKIKVIDDLYNKPADQK